MREIKAPNPYYRAPHEPSLFLAGSIEMGNAEGWQRKIVAALASENVAILNPRRDDWDSTWVQSIDNPQFRQQVEWELTMLERADVILLYLLPETQSPISLLELGLFARSGKLWVCCAEGFYRRGNVEVTCRGYGVPFFSSIDDVVDSLLPLLWVHKEIDAWPQALTR